jgi:hypothetical protein
MNNSRVTNYALIMLDEFIRIDHLIKQLLLSVLSFEFIIIFCLLNYFEHSYFKCLSIETLGEQEKLLPTGRQLISYSNQFYISHVSDGEFKIPFLHEQNK